LNIGEHDVQALTVEIPEQENIQIKGGNRNIVGDLDSNEDTTFNFEAVPQGAEINLIIHYTDEINVRRQIDKKVDYNSFFFTGRKADEIQPKSNSYYVAIGLGVVLVLIFIRSRWIKRKKKLHHLHHRHEKK
jgi:hypothetical protein